MSSANIVHIAPTPLVGAPGKVAYAQNRVGHKATSVALSDYPNRGPLAGFFTDKTILLSSATQSVVEHVIEEADIVHIHNFVPGDKLDWLVSLNQTAKFVYQAHSPLREGPLYVKRASQQARLPFDRHLVVGQYLGRHYPDYTPVPNIVLDVPSIRERRPDEKLKVIFSPTHSRPGRWNNKYTPKLEKALIALETVGKIDLIAIDKPVAPAALMEMRRRCHVTIDEIATGAFHQVSLEGMCAGNVVINRADYFSKATFASFCEGEMPPFTYADDDMIHEFLMKLAEDVELTVELQRKTHDYYLRHCDPLRLVKVFDDAY